MQVYITVKIYNNTFRDRLVKGTGTVPGIPLRACLSLEPRSNLETYPGTGTIKCWIVTENPTRYREGIITN